MVLVGCATAQPLEGFDGSVALPVVASDAAVNPAPDDTPGAGGTYSGGSAGAAGQGATDGSGGAGSGGSPVIPIPGAGGTLASGGASTTMAASGGASAAAGGAMSGDGATSGAGGACQTGQKSCAGACVNEAPANGCSAATCSACPVPAPSNGVQICNTQGQCDFECLSGFQKNGSQCTSGNGTVGGTGGAGASGPVRCGILTCLPCFGTDVACCDKLQGLFCVCAPAGQTAAFCH